MHACIFEDKPRKRETMARVLIIDDLSDWREFELVEPLEPLGHEISKTSSLSGARQEIEKNHFDLVILNICLDGKTGPEVVARWTVLLDKLMRRNMKTIVVTEGTFDPEIELYRLAVTAFREYKVVDFIVKKDFNAIDYRGKVEKAIAGGSTDCPTLDLYERQELIAQLARLPAWEDGQHLNRRNILVTAGVPKEYINQLPSLDGPPEDVAANVITHLMNVPGYVEGKAHLRPVCLIVSHLLRICITVEDENFLIGLNRKLATSDLGDLNQMDALIN